MTTVRKSPAPAPAPATPRPASSPKAAPAKSSAAQPKPAKPADSFQTAAQKPRVDLADPIVRPRDAGRLDWLPTGGQLFVDGLSPKDVQQGYVGDCYFASSLGALAQQDPAAIKNAIRDNGDGTYTVRFLEPRMFGEPKASYVTIDGDLPLADKKRAFFYAHSKDPTEKWVALLEKAWAQKNGGYEAIAQGGYPNDVLGAFTGRKGWFLPTMLMPKGVAYSMMQDALASGKAVVAGTSATHDKSYYAQAGLGCGHAYTVLGVSEENGQRYVTLRDPYGDQFGNRAQEGLRKLTLEDFDTYFDTVSIN